MPDELQNLSHAEAEVVAWQFLLAAHNVTDPNIAPLFLSFDAVRQQIVTSDRASASTCLSLGKDGIWSRSSQIPLSLTTWFDLYLPVIGKSTAERMVIAHLGQSIDSQIATASGDSFYVTGEQNRKHLHCLRALSDAVIVGAGTIQADDPQLTTRAVPGENPVRVIIDPSARLQQPLGVFNDAQAKTILVHASSTDLSNVEMRFGPEVTGRNGVISLQVERWVVPDSNSGLSAEKIVDLLASHGLARLFIEGGGITVSRFLEAGCLNRLHVAIAPLLVGRGTPALQITGTKRMVSAHRPPCAVYRMGEDVLWDLDVSEQIHDSQQLTTAKPEQSSRHSQPTLQRLF